MSNQLVSLWEDSQTRFLADANDDVTIYYKDVRAGQSSTFDEYFQESSDSSDPSTFTVTSAAPTPVTVYGKTHLDLYGASVSGSEDIQHTAVGKKMEADALFTCLMSDALETESPFKTIFDDAFYITVGKHYDEKYEVVGIKPRGLGNPFVCDVFLKLTNK